MSKKTQDVSLKVEEIRQGIAKKGNKKVNILYSPKPGTAGDIVTEDIRPKHGKMLEFTMEQVAKTGKDKIKETIFLLKQQTKALFLYSLFERLFNNIEIY